MKLYFDATDNLKTVVKLNEKELVKTYSAPRDQDILGAIKQLMDEQKISWKQITEIEVNPGPGSFTGSRLGVAIANALAFALNLKVNGSNPPVEPVYSSAPNITKPHVKLG